MGKIVKIKWNHKIYSLYLKEQRKEGESNKKQIQGKENKYQDSCLKPKHRNKNIEYKWTEQSNEKVETK